MTTTTPSRVGGTDTGSDERRTKQRRLREVLDRADQDAVLLTSATALGWYLAGARSHVSLAADPIVAVRVTRDDRAPGGVADDVLVTDNETARLVHEELPDDVTVWERPWFAPLPDLRACPESVLADALRAARAPLLAPEIDRFARLGRDAAAVLTDALAAATPDQTERELAGAVAGALAAHGADPLVVLVGGLARSSLPHPLATDGPLGDRALLVACARRDGLIVNLSRAVAFRPLTAGERDAQHRILEVERETLDATRPGVRLSEVLTVIAGAYERHGFGADHWRGHHQGGVAGYAGRDPRATPDTHDPVRLGQAFAWNPWAPGAKVEDTVLLAGDDARPAFETLTTDPRWPVTEVGGRPRPVVWERG
ncbi:Xaa-Pro aminopeptidase [Friedmanniella endophytica]|uniref:Xaa-Pro aminopeptidase n=1 Tax=Microlunatus kandeliicorticis TaxID=1759536 RepID=A0A7W3P5P7_9ACTN|nr:M24 family metallopeptidase [Microlunatus kandeliicorticis]MBA8794143.1 Xaa-Pro aminopeptidase [Microlunatus kandeliicorticis]